MQDGRSTNTHARTLDSTAPTSGQASYWMATIPGHAFVPYLPPGVAYIRGQLESGTETGFVHWQLLVITAKRHRLGWLRTTFGPYHFEPSRSVAANDYVWKEDTRVPGTQFELGELPFNRAKRTDWDLVVAKAKSDNIDDIPCDVMVRCYHQLRSLRSDHARPPWRKCHVAVYWGTSHSGKSHRAWTEATDQAYVKMPTTKWFCGLRREANCVIDEFRGEVSVGHLLRWFDKYPCRVETKGGNVPLYVENWWLTSNLHPRDWYPDLDEETKAAFLRRLDVVVHYPFKYVFPAE